MGSGNERRNPETRDRSEKPGRSTAGQRSLKVERLKEVRREDVAGSSEAARHLRQRS